MTVILFDCPATFGLRPISTGSAAGGGVGACVGVGGGVPPAARSRIGIYSPSSEKERIPNIISCIP